LYWGLGMYPCGEGGLYMDSVLVGGIGIVTSFYRACGTV